MRACETLAVSPGRPAHDAVRRAAREVRSRRVVAAPTDTLYGLLADARVQAAVARVFRAKRRPRGKPIPLLLHSVIAARRVAADLPDGFDCLASAFWPGALTLVVGSPRGLPDLVTGGLGTVALRVPGSPLVRSIARQAGCPLTGTSANRSGRRPARSAGEVLLQMEGRLALVLDGGPVRRAVPSTIVDLSGSRPALLRVGAVNARRIDRVLRDALGHGLAPR